jgi:G3E family GTPase
VSIPLHLVTGFLGSGKTTFLKHYLGTKGNTGNTAIIQNEFSPVNVDGRELQEFAGYKVMEVNNGSVFCVCLLGSFVKSLAEFIERVKPDELIMEASGMSDPVSIGQILEAEPLRGKVYLGYVWAIADARNYLRTNTFQQRIASQLRIADTVIVNKKDLAGENAGEVTTAVKKLNPFARVIESAYAQIDIDTIKKAIKLYPGETVNSPVYPLPGLESVVVKTSREAKQEGLPAFIEELKGRAIRCKGFVRISATQGVFIQGTFDDYCLHPAPDMSGPTEFVVIGARLKELRLQGLFEKYCNR